MKRWLALAALPLLLAALMWPKPGDIDPAKPGAAGHGLALRQESGPDTARAELSSEKEAKPLTAGEGSSAPAAGDFLSRWQLEMSKADTNPCATANWPWGDYPRHIALRPLEAKAAQLKSCPAESFWRFLVAATPTEAADALANSAHPGLKLYRALTLAGMMDGDGFSDTPINLTLARQLLRELMKADPTNSAPILFLAVIETKLGSPAEKAIPLFENSFSLPRFDLYGVELWQCLFKISESDLRYYFLTKKGIESAPAPAYWRVVKLASDLVPLAPAAFFRRMEEFSLRQQTSFESERPYGAARLYEDTAFRYAKAMRRVAYRGLGKDHTSLPLPSEDFAWAKSETESAREYAFPPSGGCKAGEMPRYAESLAREISQWQKRKAGE